MVVLFPTPILVRTVRDPLCYRGAFLPFLPTPFWDLFQVLTQKMVFLKKIVEYFLRSDKSLNTNKEFYVISYDSKHSELCCKQHCIF